MSSPKPSVYLAGPGVFHPAAKALFSYMQEICDEHGLRGVAPIDGALELADLPQAEQAAAIRAANLEKIRACDVILACISPFRGPGADAGTAWEMGFGEALGKIIIPWTEESAPYASRVPHDRDEDGRLFCRQHGMQVEDFGLVDNLMLTAAALPVQPGFDEAVKEAARLLGVEKAAPVTP